MEELNYKDLLRKAIVPTILVVALFFAYFYKDSVLQLFTETKYKAFAEISILRNDVRKKDARSIDFKLAQINESIYHGDSLSTGSSSAALVTFKSGQILNVDQNSLIIFDELTDVPEFVRGNIKLTVKGKMKLKVDNEVIEIDGGENQSDIQIYKDEKIKSQKIVLLTGQAQIQTSHKRQFISLQKNIPVEAKNVIRAVDILEASVDQIDTLASEPTVVAGRPIFPQKVDSVPQFYKLYDFYSRLLSSSNEFGLNKNFAMRDALKFEVFSNSKIILTNLDSKYLIRIHDSEKVEGYVVEISNEENFKNENTKRLWRGSYFSQELTVPGNYFLRYRKVLSGQVLTEYSSIQKILVKEKVKAMDSVAIEKPPEMALESMSPAEFDSKEPLPSYTGTEKPNLEEKRKLAAVNKVFEKARDALTLRSRDFKFSFDNRFSQFSASSDAANSKAQILTQRDLNLQLALHLSGDSIWRTSLIGGVRNIYFADTEAGLTRIGQHDVWGSNLQGVLSYSVDPNLSSYLAATLSQEIFFQGLGTSTLQPKTIFVPIIAGGTEYWFANLAKLDLGLNAQVEWYFPSTTSDYSVSSGYGLRSAFVMRYGNYLRDITAGIGYSYKSQDSNSTKQTESGIALFLSSTFSSGEKEKK